MCRFEELTRLGFVWESPNDIIWREKYERLVAYKESYGDCVVPGNYAADPSLAVWVKYQRDAKRKGRLSDRQISLLEEVSPPSHIHHQHRMPPLIHFS